MQETFSEDEASLAVCSDTEPSVENSFRLLDI